MPGSFQQGVNLNESVVFTPAFWACENGITRYTPLRAPAAGAINSQGFRSPEMVHSDSISKFKVGLIGDSFTYGQTAIPLDSCFADLLRADKRLDVDNMGVEGADLHQLYLLAAWYVPLYKPDKLYVILSAGDYDTNFKRETIPNQPLFYLGSAGAVPTFDPCGRFMFDNPQDSWQYWLDSYTMRNKRNPCLKALARTNIGTLLYKKFVWNDPADACANFEPLSWFYLDKIDSICSMYAVSWEILIIRGRDENVETKESFKKLYQPYLKNWDFLFPELDRHDYRDGADSHVNNSGHRKIKEVLLNDIYRSRNGLMSP